MKSIHFGNSTNHNRFNSSEGISKRKRFKQRFSISKEKLTRDDIYKILSAMNANSEEKDIDIAETIKKLFIDLDKKNTGFIKTNDLVEQILLDEENSYLEFRNVANELLRTKSEDIIIKLKKLQNKPWLQSVSKFKDNIDTIIEKITEENLNEIDLTDFTLHAADKKKEELGIIRNYSHIGDAHQKEKDFKKLKSNSRVISGKNISVKANEEKENSMIIKTQKAAKRRSTNLSNMISPSIIARVYAQMRKIDQCDFNIFELDELLGKKASIYIAVEVLGKFNIVDNGTVECDIFKNFIEEIVEHYDRINAIYHNDLHAADVMQTCYTIFTRGNIQNKLKLEELDIFSMLVGAFCHDYKHTGQNNLYHINTKSKIAMRYNDVSVLENYHIAQSFKVISQPSFNIFKNFPPEEYRICRRRMIEGILATDMANHQKVLNATRTKVESYEIVKGNNFEKIVAGEENDTNLAKMFDSQQCILNMILHTADISNPAKPSKISELWTKRVYGEFFIQGEMEKERGLPISNFCDRETTNVNKAMIGFITFVVGPTIESLVNLIPEVSDYNDYCKKNLRKHKIGAKNDEQKAYEMKKKKK